MDNNNINRQEVTPQWVSPRAIAESKRWPIGGIRHLIFNADKNGFSICIRRIGRKILISNELFDKFIEEEGGSR